MAAFPLVPAAGERLGEPPQGAAAICRGVTRMLADMGYGVLAEVSLATGRRVDLMALDRKGCILVVEVKSGPADFLSDRKWPQYLEFCDRFCFAVDAAFPQDLLPPEPGLIVADAWGAVLLREPPESPLAPARRRALTLRFARHAAERLRRLQDPGL